MTTTTHTLDHQTRDHGLEGWTLDRTETLTCTCGLTGTRRSEYRSGEQTHSGEWYRMTNGTDDCPYQGIL